MAAVAAPQLPTDQQRDYQENHGDACRMKLLGVIALVVGVAIAMAGSLGFIPGDTFRALKKTAAGLIIAGAIPIAVGIILLIIGSYWAKKGEGELLNGAPSPAISEPNYQELVASKIQDHFAKSRRYKVIGSSLLIIGVAAGLFFGVPIALAQSNIAFSQKFTWLKKLVENLKEKTQAILVGSIFSALMGTIVIHLGCQRKKRGQELLSLTQANQ